jgi:radical SAM-linked protein
MRVRIRFDEHGKIRWLSHRDVARIWERALRRAGLPAAYTEGFSPRPKLSFGLALSTGYESDGEYVDIELRADTEVDADTVPELLTPVLPSGMTVQVAAPLLPGTDSLQQAVTSCTWRIEVASGVSGPTSDDVRAAVARALAASQLPVEIERKGQRTVHDVRPGILALELAPPAPADDVIRPLRPAAVLLAELATQPRSLRPSELLRALDPTWVEGLVTRTHQWTQVDGARCEPLPLASPHSGATSTAHAGARAS